MAGFKFKPTRAVRAILHQLVIAEEAGEFADNEDVVIAGHKFVRICQRCAAYRCESLGLVVKRPNFILAHNTPLKVRVPTVKLSVEGWVVQPIVEKRNTKRAMTVIRRKLGNFYCDLHCFNVGWWRGKAVMYDW